MHLKPKIDRLLLGGITPLGINAVPSGIRKYPVSQAYLGPTGFTGDKQGDTKRHGGIEKAVHQYCFDHYAHWRDELGNLAVLDQAGAFGENLAVKGLDENDVCVGDHWAIGDALIQVSQARQPCWRLNARFEIKNMARRLQRSGRTGWYYRVLDCGQVQEGDELKLIRRPNPDWPVSRLVTVLYNRTHDWDALASMSQLEELSDSWKNLAARRLESGRIEDWSDRLGEQE